MRVSELNSFIQTEMGNIFTQTKAISKQKKIEIPDWRQIKVLSKDFKVV